VVHPNCPKAMQWWPFKHVMQFVMLPQAVKVVDLTHVQLNTERVLSILKEKAKGVREVGRFVIPKVKMLYSASQVLELLQTYIMALSNSPVVAIAEVQCDEVSDQFSDDADNLADFVDQYKQTQFKVSPDLLVSKSFTYRK